MGISKVNFSVETSLIEDLYIAEPVGSGVRDAIWEAIAEIRPDLAPVRVSHPPSEAGHLSQACGQRSK